ncbi:MAG: hypothetical protein HY658_08500 [Actinobacteria bacterium]|nr:hypothetical protein [Actinomycetota bacterium]
MTRSAAVAPEDLVLRADVGGHRHRVARTPCDDCGCPWEYSIDEPGVFWEPGPARADDCGDRACDCHIAPLDGIRFRVAVR